MVEEQSARAAAQAQSTDLEEGLAPTDERELPAVSVLEYLARNPDIGRLLVDLPSLTLDDVRASLAFAERVVTRTSARSDALSGAEGSENRPLSRLAIDSRRTQGLPPPDDAINKLEIFRTLLAPLRPGRMLDLGAGKGNFSVAAAEFGWAVTAVDARTVRLPDPTQEKVPERAELIKAIQWVQADVREFEIRTGAYDLICILGLLHHLEVPDQVALLKRCSAVLTVIDTRIARSSDDQEGSYEGERVREHGQTREERDNVPTASWGNALSFRHTEESLLRLARDCGYTKLLQMRPPHRRDYTFYLCLPAVPPRQRALRRAERLAQREEQHRLGDSAVGR